MPTSTAKKIPVKSISIEQLEGQGPLIKATVSSYAAASIVLARICSTLPSVAPFHAVKVSFTILFLDGESYTGRIDARHNAAPNFEGTDVQKHARDYLTFLAGMRCPKHLTQEQYEQYLADAEKRRPGSKDFATAWLINYALEDAPNLRPIAIERNDRPRPSADPAPAKPDTLTYTQRDGTKIVHERVKDPAPVPVPGKLPIIPEMLRLIETQLTVALAELEKEVARRIYLKTTDRANDVASVASAQAKALEIRKALAAVIKARE